MCFACTCAPASADQHFARADAVFSGRVTDVDETPDGRTWTFDVEDLQKGGIAPVQTIETGSEGNTCAPSFAIGRRYQVFAARNASGRMETSICAGTAALGASERPFEAEQTHPPTTLIPGRGEGPAPTASGRLGAREGEAPDGAEGAGASPPGSVVRDYGVAVGIWAVIASAIWALLRRRRSRRAGGSPVA